MTHGLPSVKKKGQINGHIEGKVSFLLFHKTAFFCLICYNAITKKIHQVMNPTFCQILLNLSMITSHNYKNHYTILLEKSEKEKQQNT